MTFGPIKVTLKNTYQRYPGGPIVYQRAVPSDLRNRYSGKTVKHDLKTANIALAAKKVEELNRRYEAEWAGLRATPESSPIALKVHAAALLKTFGLAPGTADSDSDAAGIFYDRLEDKRQRYARNDHDVYENADFEEYLNPIEHEALKLIQNKQLPTLTTALELHLAIHPQRDDHKFTTYQRRAFATLLEVTGDKEIGKFSRKDARAYLDAALPTAKTTTVRRRLGVMSAVFAT